MRELLGLKGSMHFEIDNSDWKKYYLYFASKQKKESIFILLLDTYILVNKN